jgi:hypothetical protein
MFTNVLVVYENSPGSANALQAAIAIAQAFRGHLCIATIVQRHPIYLSFATSAASAVDWRENRLKRCKTLEAQALRIVLQADLPVDADVVRLDQGDSVLDCVRRHRADLLVFTERARSVLNDLTLTDIARGSSCALMELGRKFSLQVLAPSTSLSPERQYR